MNLSNKLDKVLFEDMDADTECPQCGSPAVQLLRYHCSNPDCDLYDSRVEAESQSQVNSWEDENFRMIELSDVDEIVKISQGTEWSLQDPRTAKHYIDKYGSLHFVYKKSKGGEKIYAVYDGKNFINIDDEALIQISKSFAKFLVNTPSEDFYDYVWGKHGGGKQKPGYTP